MALSTDGIVFDVLSADPGSPVEGQLWYNTTDKQLKGYHNGAVTSVESRKSNTTTAGPTSANDSSQGYKKGSRWLNTSGNTEHVCTDNTPGSAVWILTATGSAISPAGAKGDIQFKAGGASLDAEGASGYGLNYDTVKHSLTVGPIGTNLSNNPFSANATINSYAQSNVQNLSAGASASSDIVATADNGNDNNHYADWGINGSGNADGTFTIVGALDGYGYVSGGALALGSDSANPVIFFNGGTLAANEKGRFDSNGDFVVGIAALATNATAGFPFLPGAAGTPTGVPTSRTGRVPLTFDTTNNLLYFYSGGAWKALNPTKGNSNEVNAAGDITTGSTTDVVSTSMTLTPGAGTYQVIFSGDLSLSAAGSIYTSCYANGSQVANSQRTHTRATNSLRTGVFVTCVVTVAAAQAIDIRWRVSTGTGTMGNRSLSLIKVA